MTDPNVQRPSALQWLRYTYTGSLPRENAQWVLHDATCRTWVVRHIVRYCFLMGPLIIVVMIFLPASLSIRIEACVAAGVSLLIGYMCFTTESIERRVEKAGFPFGLAGQVREERGIAAQRATAARLRERRHR